MRTSYGDVVADDDAAVRDPLRRGRCRTGECDRRETAIRRIANEPHRRPEGGEGPGYLTAVVYPPGIKCTGRRGERGDGPVWRAYEAEPGVCRPGDRSEIVDAEREGSGRA